jgi:CMP-N,N'-diacetyllegionaminic acid synthase
LISGEKVLAVIPARGGSKGIPRKNIRLLDGKPLIAWSIEAAQRSKHIDHVIVSSDDSEIIDVARSWGCDVPFVRPAELARDDTPGIAPVLHALQSVQAFECVVLLQPTSPLRTSEDIDGCLDLMYRMKSPACVSLTEAQHSPYWMYTLDGSNRMAPVLNSSAPILRRQDSPRICLLNGAVYTARSQWLMERQTFLADETVGYMMPPERSLDIDTEIDFVVAEHCIRQLAT